MFSLSKALFPEIVLVVAASVLFLLGVSPKPASRRFAPVLALLALSVAFLSQLGQVFNAHGVSDPWQSIHISEFARYVKLLTAGVSVLLVMLAWPNNHDATEGPAIHFGTECAEFFGLLLLSVTGVFLVAGANDIMLLFLGIELASLPTYIMVSISRPLPVAQEAGVKYFFLGAMSAAVMLFGFSYLYGATGSVYLQAATDAGGSHLPGIDAVMRDAVAGGGPTVWMKLAIVLLVAGFAFKMAAVPLHVYAADVYQGAATPVTAFLSFIPKISGFVALIKVLHSAGGGAWVTPAGVPTLPPEIGKLLWWIALLTMTFGNVLGLLQFNIKRVFAYSSIAHSGYMLVGVAALATARSADTADLALRSVLFYLAAYGLTNVAAFGVLILLPGRDDRPATSAETFEDIAGLGRRHLGLGMAMAVSCFSLIGLPLTVGFFGKFFLVQSAFGSGLRGLVVLMMANAAIAAVYYLKIVAALFLRPVPTPAAAHSSLPWPMPVTTSIALSVIGTLILGTIVPVTNQVTARAGGGTVLLMPNAPTPADNLAAKPVGALTAAAMTPGR